MKIITREVALKNLKNHLDTNLRQFALEHGITTYETGKQNKGWKGQVLERLAGLENNCLKAPNGQTFELKSVSFIIVNGLLKPKETMAICMINQQELLRDAFYQSHCWNKLKTIILCAVEWTEKNASESKLLDVASFDFDPKALITKEIQEDYEFIRNKLATQGYESLTGADGKWIQARTKGKGHGSTTRAFYARTCLIQYVIDNC
ncbi:MAG: hypothetical protein C4562_01615 [Actinobacteria bacterium]|nr:MAG: hypothetical protein C4562_01615 [Actinomycetota bacterium]